MEHGFTYEKALAVSERVAWRIEDIIGPDKALDFTRPFLPESFARTEALDFLSPRERIVLNQIRGNAYLCIFGLVEEFILPFVLDHARQQLAEDDARIRALLGFAAEEAKHIDLFKRFRIAFEEGFGTECAVLGPPSAVAEKMLSHSPLAVALTILHIEWMTQGHYVESVKDDQALDPQFKSLLRNHWLEEAQHAKLDTLMVEALAEGMTAQEIATAIGEYAEIGAFLDAGLRSQTEFDLDAFERATGRILTTDQRRRFVEQQHQANRWTYLGSGMSHPTFLAVVESIHPESATAIREMAPRFC